MVGFLKYYEDVLSIVDVNGGIKVFVWIVWGLEYVDLLYWNLIICVFMSLWVRILNLKLL